MRALSKTPDNIKKFIFISLLLLAVIFLTALTILTNNCDLIILLSTLVVSIIWIISSFILLFIKRPSQHKSHHTKEATK